MIEEGLLQRSRVACVRCKTRKTKCSGTSPCGTCATNKVECVYPRKPKKIKIYDTELEDLKAKLAEYENRQHYGLDSGYSPSSDVTGTSDQSVRADPFKYLKNDQDNKNNDMSLSILLSSPSCELITWNLTNFLLSKNTRENFFTITPEFSSFMEADCYDDVLFRPALECLKSKSKVENCYNLLKEVELGLVQNYLHMVSKYLNVGYFTVDHDAFEHQLPKYYTLNGKLKPLPETEQVDYFIIKILLIIALGLVYDSQNCIGVGNPKLTFVPGLVHFKVALNLLPAKHQLLNFGIENFQNNLQTIEIYGLMAIYSRIFDKKNASCFFATSALQLGVSMNLHKRSMITKSRQLNFSYYSTMNYNTRIFWSIYCLNRFYSARIGQPVLLSFKDISLNQDQLGTDLQCYVELGRISELINREIYNNSSFHSKDYFNTLFYILSLLKSWTNQLPINLQLDFKKADNDVSRRSMASLHLNHLHHVYLNCIPFLLHLAKVKIFGFRETQELNHLKLSNLPQNIQDFFLYCIKSSQLTVTIFIKLLDRRLIRAFGSVELDFLYSSALVFFICIILNLDDVPVKYDLNKNFEENFLICLTFMRQMALMGNLVAESKVKLIVDMAEKFDVILKKSTSLLTADRVKKTNGNTALIKNYSPANIEETDYTNTSDIKIKPEASPEMSGLTPPLEAYIKDELNMKGWDTNEDQIFANLGILNNQDLDSLMDINTGTGNDSRNQFVNITEADLNFMSLVLHDFDRDLVFD